MLFLIATLGIFGQICWSRDRVAVPCLLGCKDNHMHRMSIVMGEVSEWSLDFVTPIQAILRKAPTYEFVKEKIDSLCSANTHYAKCLKVKCDYSAAQQILLAGIGPWNMICSSYYRKGDLLDVLPCWSRYRRRLESACHAASRQLSFVLSKLANASSSQLVRTHFDMLCRSVKNFDSCYLTENQKICGAKATNFLLRLHNATSHSLHKMLSFASVKQRLPPVCEHWVVPFGKDSDSLIAIRAALLNTSSSIFFHSHILFIVFLYFVSLLFWCFCEK